MKIVVCSYRGGSGKSLFSLMLATSILENNLIIEADFLAPSLHYLLDDVNAYWNDYLLDRPVDGDLIVKQGGMRFVCTKPNDTDLFTHIQNREIWTNEFSDRILDFLEYQSSIHDNIIIDNQAGTFFSSIVHVFFSDVILCLVRPDIGDVIGTRDYLKSLNKNFYIIWNQVLDRPEMHDIIDKWNQIYFESMDYYLGELGRIAYDQEAVYLRWVKQELFVYGTQFESQVKEIAKKLEKFTEID